MLFVPHADVSRSASVGGTVYVIAQWGFGRLSWAGSGKQEGGMRTPAHVESALLLRRRRHCGLL